VSTGSGNVEPLRVAVLVSGRGSNLEAILAATTQPGFPARVAVVVSDRKEAPALARAVQHGVPAISLEPRDYGDPGAYEAALVSVLRAHGVELVCLAGFMRILRADMLRAFHNRILNIHPSLLPAFPGLGAQRRALEYGVRIAGATVHFVDEGLDTGPIVLQASVPVLPGDTERSLSDRILVEEHRLYPEAIRLFAMRRLTITGRQVLVESAT
jgi:phosphoribosylglycinamide formyltransferase-1